MGTAGQGGSLLPVDKHCSQAAAQHLAKMWAGGGWVPGNHSGKIPFSFPFQLELHPQDMASAITVPGKH